MKSLRGSRGSLNLVSNSAIFAAQMAHAMQRSWRMTPGRRNFTSGTSPSPPSRMMQSSSIPVVPQMAGVEQSGPLRRCRSVSRLFRDGVRGDGVEEMVQKWTVSRRALTALAGSDRQEPAVP